MGAGYRPGDLVVRDAGDCVGGPGVGMALSPAVSIGVPARTVALPPAPEPAKMWFFRPRAMARMPLSAACRPVPGWRGRDRIAGVLSAPPRSGWRRRVGIPGIVVSCLASHRSGLSKTAAAWDRRSSARRSGGDALAPSSTPWSRRSGRWPLRRSGSLAAGGCRRTFVGQTPLPDIRFAGETYFLNHRARLPSTVIKVCHALLDLNQARTAQGGLS